MKTLGYLERILDKINKNDNISVGLLIAENCTKALEPTDFSASKNNESYEIKKRLGWCIVDPLNDTRNKQGIHCNRITNVKENDVKEMLTSLDNLEFIGAGPTERQLKACMSRKNQKFMKILQEGKKTRYSHYQVPFMFKDRHVNFLHSRYQARPRFS